MTDAPDFWSSFVVDDKQPPFRRFLHRERPPDTQTQTTGYYAHGYAFAFQRLIMIAIDLWPQAPYLQMPTFFLARHAAELHLKRVIKDYSAANRVEYEAVDEHGLMQLWNAATAQVRLAGWPTDDGWTQYCGKLVQHMHDIDPNGQRFRYPHDNAGKPFEYTRIELLELGKAHANITTWSEAAIDTLAEARP
ncbi:MAG: hypothetical protein AAB403_06440 [Planctomycetota bacterium]